MHERDFFRLLVENTPDLITVLDAEGKVVYVSPSVTTLLGYQGEEVEGKSILDFIHPDDVEAASRDLRLAGRGAGIFAYSVQRVRHKDGSWRVFESSARNLLELPKVGGVVVNSRDITDRLEADRLLRVQRDLAMLGSGPFHLENFLKAAVAGVVLVTGMEACLVHLVDEKTDGLRLVAHTGLPGDLAMLLEYVKPESTTVGLLKQRDSLHLDLSSEPITDHPLRALRDAGFSTLVSASLKVEGEFLGCLCALSRPGGGIPAAAADLVEVLAGQVAQAVSRFRLYAALRDSEAKYRLLHDHAGEAILSFDRDLRLSSANRRARELLGFEEDEALLGMSLLELGILPPPGLELLLKRMGSLIAGDDDFREELRLVRRDGREIDAEVTGAAVRDEEGDLVGITCIVRDVTERRDMERILRQSEERYRATFESTGTAMFLVDRDATISDVNPETEKVFGYGREEMVGRMRYMQLLMPEEVERVKDYSRRLMLGNIKGPVQYEIVARRKDGTPLPALITVSMIPGIDKSVISLIDISEKKAYEKELEERAEQLRDFLDVAAHELRHPTTLLKGYALTLESYGDRLGEEETANALRAIQEGADRLVGVVEELLDVSRIERGRISLQKSEVEAAHLARRAVGEMRDREPGREIELEVRGEPGRLWVDAERIVRLLVILLDNAVKFSPPEEPVEVTVEGGKGEVLFSVLDRGTGIPEHLRERVFERFFQAGDPLHHAGPGLGLGLYIARNLVELHGGRIWCEPRAGGGSAFRFTVPR